MLWDVQFPEVQDALDLFRTLWCGFLKQVVNFDVEIGEFKIVVFTPGIEFPDHISPKELVSKQAGISSELAPVEVNVQVVYKSLNEILFCELFTGD